MVTRTQAVQRINRDIGFRPAGNPLEATIVDVLQEAQRDLEKGKTLPKFLLLEDQTLTFTAGTHTIAKPARFLRESDEVRIRFFPTSSTVPRFLTRKLYIDAVEANLKPHNSPNSSIQPTAPSVYVMRQSTIDFITVADATYTLYWDYYQSDLVLTTDIENLWLKNASDWLIGEAGLRLATSLGNQQAVGAFTNLEARGRAAAFAEDIASEEASGPFVMGLNL